MRFAEGLRLCIADVCTPIKGRTCLYDVYRPIGSELSEPVIKRGQFLERGGDWPKSEVSPRSMASSVTIEAPCSPVEILGFFAGAGEDKAGDKRLVSRDTFTEESPHGMNISKALKGTGAYKAFMRSVIKNNIEFGRFSDDDATIRVGANLGRANYVLLGRARYDYMFDVLEGLASKRSLPEVEAWLTNNADVSQHEVDVELYSAHGDLLSIKHALGEQRNRDVVHGNQRIPIRRDWMPNWFNPKEPKTRVLWRDMVAELRRIIDTHKRTHAIGRKPA